MALRKLCFHTMLAAVLAWAVAGRLNRHSKEFDVPEANAGRNDLFAASFRLKSEKLPAFCAVAFALREIRACGKCLRGFRHGRAQYSGILARAIPPHFWSVP